MLNLGQVVWSENTYREFIDSLKKQKDDGFIDFSKKLIYSKREFMGIRTPIIKSYAKDIAKGNKERFIKFSKKDYYEEVLLRGFIIANIHSDYEYILPMINEYIDDIDNWSLCDLFCSSLKVVKKYPDKFWEYIQECLSSKNPWRIRFAVVLMLDYYIVPQYIKQVLDLCDNIHCDDYYVKMAVAWLISVSYVKFKDLTIEYLKNSHLDNFTYNKAIRKIVESRRVAENEKKNIKKFIRK